MNSDFISNFEQKQINGKKLILLESSDINELVTGNLAAQLVIYKSIQNFLNTVNFIQTYNNLYFL